MFAFCTRSLECQSHNMYCIANREGMYSLTKGGERIQLSLEEIQKTLCSMATTTSMGAAESLILKQSRDES